MLNRILLMVLTLVTLAILGLAWLFYSQIKTIKTTQAVTNVENIKTNQFLLSTINWSTQQNKQILFMRDQIISEWGRVGADLDYDKAFVKAECIMRECDRYPGVDPLSMLAVQHTESVFLDTLVSCKGARGSWQFMQSTARLLCDALAISYSDKVYSDPVVSTRLAGKYFDVLGATYPDSQELARFADYNGGPFMASAFLYDKSHLSPETKGFVDSVASCRERYRRAFVEYRPEKSVQTDSILLPDSALIAKAHKSKKKHKKT